MPARPKFIPIETRDGWMVSIPANMSSTGKRVRRFFENEQDAKKFAAAKRQKYHDGERGGIIPHDLAVMAGVAAELLEPHGVTILEAAKAFVARIDAGQSPETFQVRYDRALANGEGLWRPRYIRDMGKVPGWVGREFMETRLSEITPSVIAKVLSENGAKAQSTLDMRTRYVSAILNFKPRHRKADKIEIMSLRQCARFLRASECKEELWALAVLLFAGIRPDPTEGEISRLDWSAFGEAEIYIHADISKTGTDRHIPITPRLKRLIAGHPADGPVIPNNWQRVYKRARMAAKLGKAQDVTRHTFASHFLAAYGDHAAKQAMGHTANSQTIFRHYRKAITEEAGKRYFR